MVWTAVGREIQNGPALVSESATIAFRRGLAGEAGGPVVD